LIEDKTQAETYIPGQLRLEEEEWGFDWSGEAGVWTSTRRPRLKRKRDRGKETRRSIQPTKDLVRKLPEHLEITEELRDCSRIHQYLGLYARRYELRRGNERLGRREPRIGERLEVWSLMTGAAPQTFVVPIRWSEDEVEHWTIGKEEPLKGLKRGGNPAIGDF
jgi:hypothetical protein